MKPEFCNCHFKSNQNTCANSKSKQWGKKAFNTCSEFREKKTGI